MTTPNGAAVVPNSPLTVQEALAGIGSASVTPSANSLVKRDSNGSVLGNAFLPPLAAVATAGGTTVLTNASAAIQLFYGSGNQTVTMMSPAFATQPATIINTSTGVLTVNASSSGTIVTIPAGWWAIMVAQQGSPTTASQWFAQLGGPTTAFAPRTETVNTVATSSTAQTIPDPATGATISRITLTANCTLTFPTAAAGKSFSLALVQDATGSRTVTWPGTVRWPGGTAPTLTTTASKVDRITFLCDDGSSWAGFTAGLNFS